MIVHIKLLQHCHIDYVHLFECRAICRGVEELATISRYAHSESGSQKNTASLQYVLILRFQEDYDDQKFKIKDANRRWSAKSSMLFPSLRTRRNVEKKSVVHVTYTGILRRAQTETARPQPCVASVLLQSWSVAYLDQLFRYSL